MQIFTQMYFSEYCSRNRIFSRVKFHKMYYDFNILYTFFIFHTFCIISYKCVKICNLLAIYRLSEETIQNLFNFVQYFYFSVLI